jgi:hypothetical protein
MSNRLAIAAEAKKIVFVPLGKLKKSPKNVRKVPHTKADIKALAASIAALGMLQNPVVEPELGPRGKPTGHYLVNAGEGRRLAQWLRVKRKEIEPSEPIRCTLDTEHNGTENSCGPVPTAHNPELSSRRSRVPLSGLAQKADSNGRRGLLRASGAEEDAVHSRTTSYPLLARDRSSRHAETCAEVRSEPRQPGVCPRGDALEGTRPL